MNKINVLIDISLAHKKHGYAGIPQENRYLFSSLSKSDNLNCAGLILSDAEKFFGHNLQSIEKQSQFLGEYLAGSKRYNHHRRKLKKLFFEFNYLFNNFFPTQSRKLVEIDDALKDIVWRQLFFLSLDASDKKGILNQNYFISNLMLDRVRRATVSNLKAPHLNCGDYGVVIFPDLRKINLPKNVKKIIRYHDGLPVFASDTYLNSREVTRHVRGVKACEADALFVCNSDNSRIELNKISPLAAENASVIPCFIPETRHQNVQFEDLRNVLYLRQSLNSIPDIERLKFIKGSVIESWLSGKDVNGTIPRFIMTLSTIEPRKNIPTIINAWNKIRVEHPDIRLLIVGSLGWSYEDTINSMRPFVEQGMIMHLEKVAQRELSILYSSALCFISASFAEGFGIPPVEAMQCGCRTILSDIPSHRYVGKDSALYFDPYNFKDLSEKIMVLLNDKSTNQSEKMIANSQRFSSKNITTQWESLITRLIK